MMTTHRQIFYALTLLVQCLAVGTACYNVALIVGYFI